MATGYSISGYGAMIRSEPRMSAYAEALKRAITPGCKVIDIGSGPGLFSILACQYGAGSVVAIEPNDSVQLLRTLARENGYADRITIIQDISTNYAPLDQADVIVSDLRGCVPLFEEHIPTIIDARERLLAPGGALIPMRDRIWIALAHDPDYEESYQRPWLYNKFAVDLSAGHQFSINSHSKVYLSENDLRSKHQEFLILDYMSIRETDVSKKFSFVSENDELSNGLLLWFDSDLVEGIGFSNYPGAQPLVYGKMFLPFEQPISLSSSDRIEVELRAKLVGSGYTWSWTTKVFRGNLEKPECTFRQSTSIEMLISTERIRRRSSNFIPRCGGMYDIDKLCMSLLNGSRSLGEIAEEVWKEFPNNFNAINRVLDYVADLSERYSNAIGKR